MERYEKYKDSRVAWLGEIPEYWSIRKLRYLFTIKKRIAGELGFDVLSITQRGLKVKDIDSKDGQIASDGIDWLGYIPENWEVKRLRFLISIVVKLTPKA